jgi:hypothetical protein
MKRSVRILEQDSVYELSSRIRFDVELDILIKQNLNEKLYNKR